MTELDPEVCELLSQWAASPATPVSELTAEAVREDDIAVLGLQRAPGEVAVEELRRPVRQALSPCACIDRVVGGWPRCFSCTAAVS